MPNPIPTYALNTFTDPDGRPAEVFFLGREAPAPKLPIDQPYRSGYYKIGLFVRGRATLKVNLETYDLAPGSLMLLGPDVIKQWVFMSDDYEALSVFFTPELVAASGGLSLAKFPFFADGARHVVPLPAAPAAALSDLLQTIAQKYAAPHPYRAEILQSLIHILLHETASVYDHGAASQTPLTRSQLIASGFKQLVSRHHASQRGLAFYADQLCITPKHLAATVKEATGKRAAEWIAEAVVLAAKVLLQYPAATVAQVADGLGFADQSAFGRFFRRHAGLSPVAYRRR